MFFSVAAIIQDSFVVLTVVVGGEVRWGVVAPPSDLEGQDYVGCSRAVIYSTLPSTGLSGYPVGSAPSLLLVLWHLSKWFSVSVNTDLVNGEAGTGLHWHVQQRTHRQQGTTWCHSKEVPFPSLSEELHDEQHHCCPSAPIISLL